MVLFNLRAKRSSQQEQGSCLSAMYYGNQDLVLEHLEIDWPDFSGDEKCGEAKGRKDSTMF